MEAEKQGSWKINIRAKAKNFDLKLKATSFLPSSWSWKLHRLSVMLRLHKFLFKVNSESANPFPSQQRRRRRRRRRRTLKSMIFRFLDMFRTPQTKNRPVAFKKPLNSPYPETKFLVNRSRRFHYEEPICIGSLVVGIPEFLSKSFSEKDHKEINIVHSSVILLCVAVCFNKYRTGQASALLVYLMAATVMCSVVLHLDCFYVNHGQGGGGGGGYVSKLVWKAWNYAVSSGFLYATFQVIFSRICHYESQARS